VNVRDNSRIRPFAFSRRTLIASFCGALGGAFRVARAADVLTIPARIDDLGQIVVPARIGGSGELWCLLDTGGGRLLYIDDRRAAAIGVNATGEGLSAGPQDAGVQRDGRAQVDFELAGLKFAHQNLVIKPKRFNFDDGVIGMALLSPYVIELDYQAPAVRLHPPETFYYGGPGKAVPFSLRDDNPYTDATLEFGNESSVSARMAIDTGGAGSIAFLTQTFAEHHPDLIRSVIWIRDSGARASRIRRFAVGPYGIDQPIIRLLETRAFGGGEEPDGLIGVEFLRRFRVFLNYSRCEMILEPNSHYAEPSRFDASGLRIYRDPNDGHRLRIWDVISGTPAADALLERGDIVLALDNIPADRLSPRVIADVLSRAGQECEVRFQRGDHVITVTLRLKRLL
jgi:hypothetical protein